jgi:hypothetical protein
MKSKTAYILFFALIALSSACVAEDKLAFHPPRTEAERTLDSILAKDRQGDSDMRGYLIQYTQRDKSKDASYAPLFTDGFVKEVSVFEKHLVDTQCDGKYTGELCGYDASYITCNQDSPDEYLYQTEGVNDNEAIIAVIWPPEYAENTPYKTVYHLLKNGETWQLDGILCADGDSFNMPFNASKSR